MLAQDYPNVEHIVVDGMSTDGTANVLARYPHLSVIREPDRGQADAINKGFRAATGEILGFLNSDDTLEPGALRAVAEAIDPRAPAATSSWAAAGSLTKTTTSLGVEHPSAFESHRRVLEIWKGHCLPQPAIFWTREVWEACGPLDVAERLMLDYDLFCRFSQRYAFHRHRSRARQLPPAHAVEDQLGDRRATARTGDRREPPLLGIAARMAVLAHSCARMRRFD